MVAKVVTDIALDRVFDYLIPAEMEANIRIGSAVDLPFGNSSCRAGYVLELSDNSSYNGKLKPILGISKKRASIPENLISLGKWIADYYCSTQEQAIRTLLPAAVRSGKVKPLRRRLFAVADTGLAEKFIADHCNETRIKKRVAILRELLAGGAGSLGDLNQRVADFSQVALQGLIKEGMVAVREEIMRRDVFGDSAVVATAPLAPTPGQQQALKQIRDMLAGKTSQQVLLLHGVTNSGKTEVYLQAISQVLEYGKSAIVLVPEISLTPQTVRRFRARFGDELSVLHSRLSDRERYEEWNRINSGAVQIAVGARSALFAPFSNLGLIIVDEEHENSYKQSEAPRYMARDVAVMRGKFEGAAVILGSATPSAESLHNAASGKFLLSRMEEQVEAKPPPLISVVDQRLIPVEPGKSNLLSPQLQDAVQTRLERGEQTILFLNRRGYSLALFCDKCGYEARCPECSVNYVYSRSRETLSCHLCGGVIPAPEICPSCGSPELRHSGSGTEKLENFARGCFHDARIGRMDSDTMRSAADYEETLDKFRRGELNILVGTQMIAKGLHFPGVTLVGVVNADGGLSMPDFRAQEHTFQLLMQVAGRAGRGDRRGEVIFQTTHPNNETIIYAANSDFSGFAKFDLEFREMLGYPPFTRLIAIHFRGPDEMILAEYANSIANKLQPYFHSGVRVVPPRPAAFERIKGKYRYIMVIRGNGLQKIRQVLRILVLHSNHPKNIDVYADVDAQSLL